MKGVSLLVATLTTLAPYLATPPILDICIYDIGQMPAQCGTSKKNSSGFKQYMRRPTTLMCRQPFNAFLRLGSFLSPSTAIQYKVKEQRPARWRSWLVQKSVRLKTAQLQVDTCSPPIPFPPVILARRPS